MTKNKEITSHHVYGFWFHITWENESIGYDHRGTKWFNKAKPYCGNENVLIACADSYVNIINTMNR